MLNFKSYSLSHLQTFRSLLSQCFKNGITDILALENEISQHLSKFQSDAKTITPRTPDNITKCSVCGSPAIIIPVNTVNGNLIDKEFTHAIQCQNRPATDQRWLPENCGHTEYVVGEM